MYESMSKAVPNWRVVKSLRFSITLLVAERDDIDFFGMPRARHKLQMNQ